MSSKPQKYQIKMKKGIETCKLPILLEDKTSMSILSAYEREQNISMKNYETG